MISRELAAQIRRIQIRSRKAVNTVLAGEYTSVFRGRGIEFEEVREYQPGDDIRSIDWNVTARTGTLHIKRYVEEREMIVIFLLDMSASGAFGTTGKTKNEIAAEMCALIAFSAIRNNDNVGLIAFTGQVERYVPPGKGTRHVLRLIEEILEFEPRNRSTSIASALDFLGKVFSKRAVVFLISDFLDTGYEHKMKIMARKHDLIAVQVRDPAELELITRGLITFKDMESGHTLEVDASSPVVRRFVREQSQNRLEQFRKSCTAAGIDLIDIEAGKDHVERIAAFFSSRERRLRV